MSLDSNDGIMVLARSLNLSVAVSPEGPIIMDLSGGIRKRALRAFQDMLIEGDKSFNLFFTSGDKCPRIQVVHYNQKYNISVSKTLTIEKKKPNWNQIRTRALELKLNLESHNNPIGNSYLIGKQWTNVGQVKGFEDLQIDLRNYQVSFEIDDTIYPDRSYIVIPAGELSKDE